MIHIDKNHIIDMSGDAATILAELSIGVIGLSEVLSDVSGKPVEASAALIVSKVTESVKAGITELKK